MTKDLLTLNEFSGAELNNLLFLSGNMKKELKKGKRNHPVLANKTVVLIFEKPSLRTRVTFETGINQLGGSPIYLAPDTIQIGKRESAYDVAKNLERWVSAIVARTFSHKLQEELAAHASIPVINALSDDHHPCQALALGLTLKEQFGKLKGLELTFIGDGNNVAASLLLLCAKLGTHFTLACPKGYEIGKNILSLASKEAVKSGSKIRVLHDPKEAVKRADLIYTDVWASMGQERETLERKKRFSPFQVNEKLMALAPKHARFSHCLPAHRGEEATNEVLDGAASVMFDEAENRLHVQKAVLSLLVKK